MQGRSPDVGAGVKVGVAVGGQHEMVRSIGGSV